MGSSKPEPTRYVIGIGVSDYSNPTLNLAAVPDDVNAIVSWFRDKSGVVHVPVLPALMKSPTNQQIRDELRTWLEGRSADDVVVIYIGAHGEVEYEVSYIQGSDSPVRNLAGIAIDGETLGRIIGQAKPHNVLVIVDTCVAGVLGSAMSYSADRTSTLAKSRDQYRDWSQAVICSTFGRNLALDGAFAKAFVDVVSSEQWTGTEDRWISINHLMRGLNSHFGRMGIPQAADRKVWGPGSEELIPNPNFGTRRLGTLVDDTDFGAHFGPSSRGVAQGESGWYFTGRTGELRRIVAWLTGSAAAASGRLFVITGSPGSGKSALLARVIALSDPRRRADVIEHAQNLSADATPPEGAIDAVLWCRNRTVEQLMVDLGRRLGSNATTMPTILTALADASPRRWTIAVDALDEAVQGHASRIAIELIRPLVESGIYVIVATRERPVRGGEELIPKNLIVDLGVPPGSPTCLVLDESAARAQDMRAYIEARLTAASDPERPTPYRQHPALTEQLAVRIEQAAGASFLVAAVTARALANQATAIDPAAGDFKFPTEAGAALASYIDLLPNRTQTLDMLRPLAWAEGLGLPWGSVWAPVATALAALRGPDAPHYDDAAVRAVLGYAGDLIVESRASGEPAYRLFHEALAENLRAGVEPSAAHGAIAKTLESLLEQSGLEQANSYTLAHVGAHLAQSGGGARLYDLVTDPAWERAHRHRFGHSSALSRDIDAAIDAAKRQSAPDFIRIAGACAVHSSLMAVAPALVLDLVARSGQLQRAEKIANNLTFAIERAWAFALIAPAFARERDLESALRCLGESERATAAIDLTNATMAWAWIAEAAWLCGLAELAQRASAKTLDLADAFIATIEVPERDEWDLPHVVLWAGIAARAAGDETTREGLRRRFASRYPEERLFGRNLELQAAAVVGATDMLRRAFHWVIDNRATPIRDGNLALALADGGMMAELRAFCAVVENGGGPGGEADSRKRYAWALALDGRFDDALACLSRFDENEKEEQARGLRRVVMTALRSERSADFVIRDAGGSHATGVKPSGEFMKAAHAMALALSDSSTKRTSDAAHRRVQTFVAPVLFATGDRERAMGLVEELIAAGEVPTGDASLAFRKPDVLPFDAGPGRRSAVRRRGKTGRRPLAANIGELADQQAMLSVSRLAQTGHHEQAVAGLPAIQIPRYRWEALYWIAQHAPETERGQYWMEALLEARLVYGPAVRITAGFLAQWLEDKEQGLRLRDEVRRVGKQWSEASFVEQYESLRETLGPGPQRTVRLSQLMATTRNGPGFGKLPSSEVIAGKPVATLDATNARFLVPAVEQPTAGDSTAEIRASDLHWWTPAEVISLVRTGTAGQRVFALALMQGSAGLRNFDLLIEMIQQSRSAFEQYHALRVMREHVQSISKEQRRYLRAVLKKERGRFIEPGSDREGLAEAIERRMDAIDQATR